MNRPQQNHEGGSRALATAYHEDQMENCDGARPCRLHRSWAVLRAQADGLALDVTESAAMMHVGSRSHGTGPRLRALPWARRIARESALEGSARVGVNG